MFDEKDLPNNPRKPSNPVTLKMAKAMWQLKQKGHLQNRIASTLDVNPGRVSEVLNGKKFPEARPL
jgi:predicted XRE-type DNA-binding protein